ncbi:MAG: MmgE/PrpD family protein [Proteobacteria bacterium]|nr:MmgE/PrpD family protein [Pseudomonadota bacterium]
MSEVSTSAPLTGALAEFVSGCSAEGLPEPVRARILEVVLDGSGALLAAANPDYSTGRLIAAFVRDGGGATEATVVGHGFKTGAAAAALANGTMGYACDVEPHHPEAILHSIAVTVPSALALAERAGASGARFLAAVAVGLEVEYRVSMALGPREQYALGFHPSAVCGTFGAAAAAANLLRLRPEATARALGLAACQASGLMAWESDPTENSRPFQMGMAARNGVSAALLAATGFGAPTAVFDHGHTIFRAFSRAPRPELLVRDLGRRFDGVMELALKPYACCAFLHPGLDALIGLVREENLGPEEVERIVIHFARSGSHCIDGNPLKSHSAQYTLALAVRARDVLVRDIFVDRRLSDPVVSELSRRVEFVQDAGELEALFPDKYATRIEVITRSGRRIERRNDTARGYPETPMTAADVKEKFRKLAGSVASPARVEALRRSVAGLWQAPGVAEFAELLGRPAGS